MRFGGCQLAGIKICEGNDVGVEFIIKVESRSKINVDTELKLITVTDIVPRNPSTIQCEDYYVAIIVYFYSLETERKLCNKSLYDYLMTSQINSCRRYKTILFRY